MIGPTNNGDASEFIPMVEWSGLSVIPFIFIAGATIYYHAIMGAFIGGRYNLEIKIKDLTKLNLLDIEQKIGVFGERSSYPHFHEIPLGIFFCLA